MSFYEHLYEKNNKHGIKICIKLVGGFCLLKVMGQSSSKILATKTQVVYISLAVQWDGYPLVSWNQTTPFPSTGCVASPEQGREGLVTVARFLGWNVDMTNEISARVIITCLQSSVLRSKHGCHNVQVSVVKINTVLTTRCKTK